MKQKKCLSLSMYRKYFAFYTVINIAVLKPTESFIVLSFKLLLEWGLGWGYCGIVFISKIDRNLNRIILLAKFLI